MRRLEDYLNNLIWLAKRLVDNILNVRGITEMPIAWVEAGITKIGTATKFYNSDGEVKDTKFFTSKGVLIPEPTNWGIITGGSGSGTGDISVSSSHQKLLVNGSFTVSSPKSIAFTIVSGTALVTTPDNVSITYPINNLIFGASFDDGNSSGDYIITATEGTVFITYSLNV